MALLQRTVDPHHAVAPTVQSESFFVDAHMFELLPQGPVAFNGASDQVNCLRQEYLLHFSQRHLQVFDINFYRYALWCEDRCQQLHVEAADDRRFFLLPPLAISKDLLKWLDISFISPHWDIAALGKFVAAAWVRPAEGPAERVDLWCRFEYGVFIWCSFGLVHHSSSIFNYSIEISKGKQ